MSNRTRRRRSGKKGPYVLHLSFQQIDCFRCHGLRIRGQACPDCGAPPASHEFDPERQRRQRLAHDLLTYLHAEPDTSQSAGTVDLAEIYGLLRSWSDRFLRAAQRLAIDDIDRGEALRRSLEILKQAQNALILSGPALRPTMLQHRSAVRTVELCTGAANAWLSAIAAEDPLSAQSFGAQFQQRLDEAGATAAALTLKLDSWERINREQDVENVVIALYVEALGTSDYSSLNHLEAAGARDFHALVGTPGPVGIGAMFRVSELLAGVALDEQRFRAVVRDVFLALQRDPDKLDELLGAPSLRSDLLEGEVAGLTSWLAAQATWAASRTDEQSLRQLMRLASDLLEGPGKRYLAALTTLTRSQHYAERRQLKANTLIQEAVADGFGTFVEGLDRQLRNAGAHIDYVIRDNVVVLTEHGVETADSPRWRPEELIDSVLAATESCLAIYVALTAAAGSRGHTVLDGREFLARLGLSPLQLTRLFLQLAGLVDVQLAVTGSTLRVQARALADSVLESALAVAGQTMPATVDQMELEVLKDEERILLAGPTAPWRMWSSQSEGTDRDLAVIECKATWCMNGNPWLPRSRLRQSLAHYAIKAWNDNPYPSCSTTLKQIQGIARRAGDDQLASAVSALLTMSRLTNTGVSLTTTEQNRLQQLTKWGSTAA